MLTDRPATPISVMVLTGVLSENLKDYSTENTCTFTVTNTG